MKKQCHSFLLALLALWLMPCTAGAATIATAQALPQYQRLLFTGAAPQTLRMDSQGNTVTLHLSDATGDVSALLTKLKPTVTSIQRAPDGKTITLTLDKSYRVRQFVSGNTVGVDILKNQITPAPLSTKTTDAPATPLLSTKPAPAPEPAPKVVPTPKPIEKPIQKPVAPKAVAPAPVAPISTKEAPSELLTTKAEPKAADEPAPEPAPKVAPVPQPEPTSEVKPQPAASADAEFFDGVEPELKAAGSDVPIVEEDDEIIEPTHPPIASKKRISEDILVGVRKEKRGIAIDFPWTERVASAVFQRGRDIWIIFNEESRMDTVRLRTILPTSVLNVTRYKLPGNTVLKLETNGSLNVGIENKKGSYAWSVELLPDAVTAEKDIPILPNATHIKPHVMFQVFDTAEPLSFYDPAIGDRWLVVPTYEAELGIINARRFPDFSVLAAPQGIAVLTQNPDIGFQKTRAGLRLTAKDGLKISKELPFLHGSAAPVKGVSATANVLFPYDRWYVDEGDFFNRRAQIMDAIITAPKDMKPELTTQLATLYLGQGFGLEAAGFLEAVKQMDPKYYANKKLALLRAGANFMAYRMEDAALDVKSPELAGEKEAELWKDAIGLYVPLDVRVTGAIVGETKAEEFTEEPLSASEQQKLAEKQLQQIALNASIAAKGFDYLGYNKSYIQFYPPALRQRLGITAANAYIQRGKYGQAVRTFDTLNKDGLLEPVQLEAEYLLGKIAAEREKVDEARSIWERLAAQQDNPMVRTRAAYSLVTLDYGNGKIDIEEAIKRLDAMRISWRGDAQERELLDYLGQLYLDNKQFDMALRTWKELTNQFPNDPEVVNITTRTSELFERLFYDGQADELPPLKSLALFYEFRELTPIGDKGNAIIQKLADRLAAVDLIDRAAQLLEHQVKFRLSGEERARVGARLALLYLVNREPTKALNTLEITNYGEMSDALRYQRLRLSAKSLAALDRLDEALAIITTDQTDAGETLRLEVLWQMKDWANVINQAEDMMAARKDLTAPLSDKETEVLLKLALAYSFEKDLTQLNYLRDYYTSLMSDSPYKDIFSYITNNNAPIDPEDFALVTQQISNTESFMKEFRDSIAKGKLSETMK